MYAIIRKNTYDPGQLAQAGPALAQFQALHAAQPGYAGGIDSARVLRGDRVGQVLPGGTAG
jgi:hypothetical protein